MPNVEGLFMLHAFQQALLLNNKDTEIHGPPYTLILHINMADKSS